MAFETLPTGRFPRRALLGLPIAAGFAALLYPRERPLPDANQPGTGPDVQLTLFSEHGKPQGVVSVKRVVRSDAEWKRELSGNEFEVTRRRGTEFPYTNRYVNNHEAGLYRCVCCGNALFRSEDKFESGTGWPSFSAPCADTNIQTKVDSSLFMQRTEVLCRKCDAHLGHVFDDGPAPTGLRYCMNSAALRFVAYA